MLQDALRKTARRLDTLEEGRATEAPGIFQAFDPVLTQSVTITNAAGSWGYECMVGGLYIVVFRVACNSAGTTGNSIRLSGFSKTMLLTNTGGLGSFHIFDQGVTNRVGATYVFGSGAEIGFQGDNYGDLFGIVPAYTISANDVVSGFVVNMAG